MLHRRTSSRNWCPARECFDRYRLAIDRVNHCGDEAFVSAALNLLADGGKQIIDVGAYQLVGRHWSGNTHRDLRWFKHCSLLHLPGCKTMLEQQAHTCDFEAGRIWRYLVIAHMIGHLKVPVKRMLRTRLNASRQRGKSSGPCHATEIRLDALLVDSEPKALSLLAPMLTSRGITVMCTTDATEALRAAMSARPRVVVISSISTTSETIRQIESCCISVALPRRPLLIDLYRGGDRLNSTLWDGGYLEPVDRTQIVETVVRQVSAGSLLLLSASGK
ncbi:MAG TPA: response regulator [Paraburkholderia sp.]